MKPDPGMEATRAIREKISREHGNDPKRLVEHYMRHQRRFTDRLVWAPGTEPDAADLTDGVPIPDAGTRQK